MIPIEQKLDQVLRELAALRSEVRSLTAVKAAKEDTADEMVRAQRVRLERHQDPCATCGGPGVIEVDGVAGACPACNADSGTPIAPPVLSVVTESDGPEGLAAVREARERLKPTRDEDSE